MPPALLEAMKVAAGRARPWAGTIFRSAPPKWATGWEMLTGVGSMKSGARFNAPGSFPAIYGSTTPELAMIESLAYQRRANLPLERAMPLVFKAISVDVQRCLDLTDAVVLADIGLTLDQIRTETWWPARARGEESLTQAIGRAAHACDTGLFSAQERALIESHNGLLATKRSIDNELEELRRDLKAEERLIDRKLTQELRSATTTEQPLMISERVNAKIKFLQAVLGDIAEIYHIAELEKTQLDDG